MIRIPGRQATAGLERFYLTESPEWMPRPLDSGERIASSSAAVFNDLAGREVAPLAPAVNDTGELETGIGQGEAAGIDVDNRLAVATDEATLLREDKIAPAIGPTDAAVDQAGGAIGRSPAGGGAVPGVNIPIEGPPDTGRKGRGDE